MWLALRVLSTKKWRHPHRRHSRPRRSPDSSGSGGHTLRWGTGSISRSSAGPPACSVCVHGPTASRRETSRRTSTPPRSSPPDSRTSGCRAGADAATIHAPPVPGPSSPPTSQSGRRARRRVRAHARRCRRCSGSRDPRQPNAERWMAAHLHILLAQPPGCWVDGSDAGSSRESLSRQVIEEG